MTISQISTKTIRFIFLFSTLLVSTNLFSSQLETYQYKGVFEEVGKYYQYIEDCSGLSTNEVVEQFNAGKFENFKGSSRAFNQGMTSCSYWLAISVQNKWERDRRLLWSFFNSGLKITYYELIDDKLIELKTTSLHQPLMDRPFPSRGISYPFYLKKDEQRTLFAKLTPTVNGHVYAPIEMNDVTDYFIWEIGFTYLFGKIIGIFMIAMFANLCFFIFLRQKIHLYHCFYILSVLLFTLDDFHYDAFQFKGQMFVMLSYLNKGAILSMVLFFCSKVFREFTDLADTFPRLNKLLKYCNIVLLIAVIISLLVSYNFHSDTLISYRFSWILNFINNGVILILFASFIPGLLKRDKFFFYYAFASSFLLYGFIAYLLNTFDIIFLPIISPGNIIIGLVFEVVLMTVFLVYKYKIEKDASVKRIFKELRRNDTLSKKMISIQEEERDRIAREVHDEVANDIVALQLHFQNSFDTTNSDGDEADTFVNKIKLLHEKIRNVSHELMPSSYHGTWIGSLKETVAFYNNSTSINMNFSSNITNEKDVPQKSKIHISRMIKEIVSNAVRHATPANITVQLFQNDDDLTITIEDDGRGFNVKNKYKGSGLENILSRVEFLDGNLSVDSSSSGTNYLIEIPISSISTKTRIQHPESNK